MIRLGLCCLFKNTPIKFGSTTVKMLTEMQNREGDEGRLKYVSVIVLNNCISLQQAIVYCATKGIGCFRICSELFPCFTHPLVGYTLEQLPNYKEISDHLRSAGQMAKRYSIRLAMHPDQFVVLNSTKEATVNQSILELEYHAVIAQYVNVDVINIHVGGVYGEKEAAIKRFETNFQRLSDDVKKRLTLENDDKQYAPQDVIPLCRRLKIPFVYDVHHHRCTHAGPLTDESILSTTNEAKETWNGREPLFHISSPIMGWEAALRRPHHMMIDYKDYPKCWKSLNYDYTVEVEAKAKEVAVLQLFENIVGEQLSVWQCPEPIIDNWQLIGNQKVKRLATKRKKTSPPKSNEPKEQKENELKSKTKTKGKRPKKEKKASSKVETMRRKTSPLKSNEPKEQKENELKSKTKTKGKTTKKEKNASSKVESNQPDQSMSSELESTEKNKGVSEKRPSRCAKQKAYGKIQSCLKDM